MDNGQKKTSLEEAKIDFEKIKAFALEEAKKEIKKEVDEKVEKIINESLQSISLDFDSTQDTVAVTVTPEEGEAKTIEVDTTTGEVKGEEEKIEEPVVVEPEEDLDDEPIEIDSKIDEMENIKEVEQAAAPETGAAPVEANAAPSQKELVDNLANALAGIINPTEFGGMALQKSAEGGETVAQNVDFINDEEPQVPAEIPTPEAPATPEVPAEQPVVPEVPVEEPQKPVAEEDAILEFDLENIGKEEQPEEMFEIEMEEQPEEQLFEIEMEDENIEEIKGQGKVLRNTSHRAGLEPREGTPNLKESKDSKAQHESKIDELTKENKRLNESVKDFQKTFIDLRKQFDEMQTFNAKLAYANKILSSGGFSTEEKIRITEEFDKAGTAENAKKVYDGLIKEGVMKVDKIIDNTKKIKANQTHSVQSKKPLYENAEMKRQRVLAGIEPRSEE